MAPIISTMGGASNLEAAPTPEFAQPSEQAQAVAGGIGAVGLRSTVVNVEGMAPSPELNVQQTIAALGELQAEGAHLETVDAGDGSFNFWMVPASGSKNQAIDVSSFMQPDVEFVRVRGAAVQGGWKLQAANAGRSRGIETVKLLVKAEHAGGDARITINSSNIGHRDAAGDGWYFNLPALKARYSNAA